MALAESAGREPADPAAHLAANLLLATWIGTRIEAHRTSRQAHDTEEAKAIFLTLVDQGTIGLKAAMAGTPYAWAAGSHAVGSSPVHNSLQSHERA